MKSRYRKQFENQRNNAARRGIDWNLTFQQWLDWWGDDIDYRGIGTNNLQMQRYADIGPYALWNIRKGTPKQNARTRGVMGRLRSTNEASSDLQNRKDAMMFAPSSPSNDEFDNRSMSDEYAHHGRMKTSGSMNWF